MKKRVRRPAPAAASADAGGSSRHRGTLWLSGVLVGIAILGTVYFWPQHEAAEPPPTASAAPALVLPTEPEAITVDQLREEAETVVGALTERFPQSPGAHKTAAMLYEFLNQYEKASTHWESAIALDPTDPVSRAWLAKAQMKQGQDDAAAQTLKAALEAGLGTAEIYHDYAVVTQRKGQLAEAERIAEQALLSYPESLELSMVLGQSQVQLGRLEDAKASFDAALRIDPTSTAAHFAAANVSLRLGDKEAAKAHRDTLEKSQAIRQREQLPFDEDYERSLRNTVATLLSAAATEYDNRGQPSEAERLCRRAYAIQPASPEPYRRLANMYHRDGKLQQAVIVQERLIQVEPENEVNHLNFASLLFEVGRMEQGEAVLVEAARASPRKAIFPESLAVVCLRSGQLAQARHWAEQAIRLEPSAQRYRFLADTCRRLGDLAAAEAAEQAGNQPMSGASP